METDTVDIIEYNVFCGRPGYRNIGVLDCLEHTFKTKEKAVEKVAEIQCNIDAGKTNALYVYMKARTSKISIRWLDRAKKV